MDKAEDWDGYRVNGIDVDVLSDMIRDVQRDPAKGMVEFLVKTIWQGRARSETTVESCSMGGEAVARKFTVVADEPEELLGENSAINPQELLMAALNSSLIMSYAVGAAIKGIELESIEIETEAELDLRGFFGIDRDVLAGLRDDPLHRLRQRRRHGARVPRGPRVGHGDFAQLLQYRPTR